MISTSHLDKLHQLEAADLPQRLPCLPKHRAVHAPSLQIAPVCTLTDEEVVLKPEQKETVTSGEGVTISPASIDE